MKARPHVLIGLLIAVAGGILAWPMRVLAQGAESAPAIALAELRFRLRRGETVFVTSTAGLELSGELEAVVVDRDVLLLDVRGISLELPVSGIRAIHRPRRDSLKNGALIGLGHGVAASLLLAAISKEATTGPEFLHFLWLTAPIGAGLGAAIDSAHKSRELVFQQDGRGFAPSIESLLGTQARRVEFSIRLVW